MITIITEKSYEKIIIQCRVAQDWFAAIWFSIMSILLSVGILEEGIIIKLISFLFAFYYLYVCTQMINERVLTYIFDKKLDSLVVEKQKLFNKEVDKYSLHEITNLIIDDDDAVITFASNDNSYDVTIPCPSSSMSQEVIEGIRSFLNVSTV
jgi:hypothetical protein